MQHFVVTYHRLTGAREVRVHEDALEAFDEFARLETSHLADEETEVVMLFAESEADLHRSHPNFFEPGDLLPA